MRSGTCPRLSSDRRPTRWCFASHQDEKKHVAPLTHHPKPHALVLNVGLSQPRWHFCKHIDSKYSWPNEASCFYSGGCGSIASVGRASIGRLSGARRQMVDSQATIGRTKVIGRPVFRLRRGYRPMIGRPSAEFGCPRCPWSRPTISRLSLDESRESPDAIPVTKFPQSSANQRKYNQIMKNDRTRKSLNRVQFWSTVARTACLTVGRW